ncbi:MAG: hypothetical protein JWO59_3476 [Chloroflexi bacterium]|nr:hypothetical protein [Chloroflexota bacterium]
MSESIAPRNIALRVVWSYIRANGCRPTAGEVDRALYRDHSVRIELISALSAELFTITPAPIDGRVDDNALVGMTVAGVDATGEGRRVLELFLTAVRQAADREREFEPAFPGDVARFTASDFSAFNLLTSSGADEFLPCVGELLRAEPWGGTWIEGAEPMWAFETGRGVRRFAEVPDLTTYLRLRGRRRITPKPRFDSAFWTALASVFTMLGVLVAAAQRWPIEQALSLVIAVTGAVLALHRHRLDRWSYTYAILAGAAVLWFATTFHREHRSVAPHSSWTILTFRFRATRYSKGTSPGCGCSCATTLTIGKYSLALPELPGGVWELLDPEQAKADDAAYASRPARPRRVGAPGRLEINSPSVKARAGHDTSSTPSGSSAPSRCEPPISLGDASLVSCLRFFLVALRMMAAASSADWRARSGSTEV